MDEYQENIGRRSTNMRSRLISDDPATQDLVGRMTAEIMAETNGGADPLLILNNRTGEVITHIYERSSANKPYERIGDQYVGAYRVTAEIPWTFTAEFYYTKRIPNNCDIYYEISCAEQCGEGLGKNIIGVGKCSCSGRIYQGASESAPILWRIISGTSNCFKIRDNDYGEFGGCQYIPIPVQEVQTIVR